MKKQNKRPSPRVFPWLVDKAAFVDKIVLSVNGKVKQDFDYELVDPESKGILHPGTIYSRRVSAVFGLTGNPLLIRYGKAKKFENVPEAQIVIQSEAVPVTAAQAFLLVKKLTQ